MKPGAGVPQAGREQALVRAFVTSYLSCAGAAAEEVSPGILRAEVPARVAAELEGSAWLGWLSPQDAPAHVTYYFTFDPSVAARQADVELIAPGSWRLERMAHSVRRTARAFGMWLPVPRDARYDPAGRGLRYRPFYLFLLSLRTPGGAAPYGPVSVAVDRVDQLALRQLAEMLPRLPLRPGRPDDGGETALEPPRTGFERAFELAFEEVLRLLEAGDAAWAGERRSELAREKERLERFYAERAAEGEDVTAERDRRLAELDRLAPRVFVGIEAVADLYLPVAQEEDGTVRHLAFAMRTTDEAGFQP